LPSGPVLVVDDDAAVRCSLKFCLEQEGFEVRVYESGAQILADRELPLWGCLVIDLSMPAMDGIDLMNRLRERFVELPAILMTVAASADLQSRARCAGYRLVLEKPLEDNSLLHGIEEALGTCA
jgi:FixJ family two-component response regulator